MKGKILKFIGIGLLVIGFGIIFYEGIFHPSGFSVGPSNIVLITIVVIMPIVIGSGLLIFPIIQKMRKPKSDFEKEVGEVFKTSRQQIQDSQDIEKPMTDSSEKTRKCRVCGTSIPPNKKTCSGCGDIFS